MPLMFGSLSNRTWPVDQPPTSCYRTPPANRSRSRVSRASLCPFDLAYNRDHKFSKYFYYTVRQSLNPNFHRSLPPEIWNPVDSLELEQAAAARVTTGR